MYSIQYLVYIVQFVLLRSLDYASSYDISDSIYSHLFLDRNAYQLELLHLHWFQKKVIQLFFLFESDTYTQRSNHHILDIYDNLFHLLRLVLALEVFLFVLIFPFLQYEQYHHIVL